MTFSRFDAANTREIVGRMATEKDEAQVSNRQFAIALAAVVVALALFALVLVWL